MLLKTEAWPVGDVRLKFRERFGGLDVGRRSRRFMKGLERLGF